MSLVSRIESLATRIGDECKLLWAEVNGKAAASHDHNGVYEPANSNIQGHIADVPKHIDWTNAASDFKTTGQVKVAGVYFADFVLQATGNYAIDITFQRDATMLAKIHVPISETDLVFSVGTANPLRLKSD